MQSPRPRPFRFTVQASRLPHPDALVPLARKAEDLGVAVLTVADHLDDQLAPIAALMAVADATTTLRVGSLVFANDYRHPVVLAKEAATIDVLSGGRLEFGLGAGWMAHDYQPPDIADGPSRRAHRAARRSPLGDPRHVVRRTGRLRGPPLPGARPRGAAEAGAAAAPADHHRWRRARRCWRWPVVTPTSWG